MKINREKPDDFFLWEKRIDWCINRINKKHNIHEFRTVYDDYIQSKSRIED